jgi:putative intracellular protease/amidase
MSVSSSSPGDHLETLDTAMRILMILVSDTDPDYRNGEQGAELGRFVMPYYLFQDAGIDVTLASRDGGAPWVGPAPSHNWASLEGIERFKADQAAREELSDTLCFDQIDVIDFDAAFCVGAPVAIWDVADAASSATLIARFLRQGKPVATACSILDLAPDGASEGLLIVSENQDSSLLAAKALLAVLNEQRHPEIRD